MNSFEHEDFLTLYNRVKGDYEDYEANPTLNNAKFLALSKGKLLFFIARFKFEGCDKIYKFITDGILFDSDIYIFLDNLTVIKNDI